MAIDIASFVNKGELNSPSDIGSKVTTRCSLCDNDISFYWDGKKEYRIGQCPHCVEFLILLSVPHKLTGHMAPIVAGTKKANLRNLIDITIRIPV